MDEKKYDLTCDMVFSVYDSDAQEFGPLFQCTNEVIAVKKFVELLKGFMYNEVKEYGIVDHGNYDRYRLYSVGVFDRLEGVFLPEKREIEVYPAVDMMIEKMNTVFKSVEIVKGGVK